MGERRELFMRILVLIVSGIILAVWRWFIIVLAIVNWFYTLFTAKRMRELAEMSEIWNTQMYTFFKYMTFVTNQRPFPFESLTKNMSKFER